MKLYHYLLIVGFILEGIITNFIPIQTKLFNPLLLFVTIVFVYPYFKNDKKYYKTCLIYGIIYDLIYTNTLIFHGILFLLIGYIVHYLYKLFSLNIINITIIVIGCIVIYRILGYLLVCLVSSYNFSWFTLLNSITSSLILNVIYISFLYIIINKKYHYFKV